MITYFSVVDKTTTGLTLRLSRQLISKPDYAVYVIYDTDSGEAQASDYYIWRGITIDTPNTVPNYAEYIDIVLTNTGIFPPSTAIVADYTTLNNSQLKIISLLELEILSSVKDRVDTVRKRLPNPGTIINDTDGIGDGGMVDYAGGFYKKFEIEEYLRFMQGALIEVNITSPKTEFWWEFLHKDVDLNPNPYKRGRGVPVSLSELIVKGAVIRALNAWGLLEVDLGFQTNDSGLALTFNRSPQILSWLNVFIADYEKNKKDVKMDFINSYGVAVGTAPFFMAGLWGRMVGMTASHNTMALSSILGFNGSATRPM